MKLIAWKLLWFSAKFLAIFAMLMLVWFIFAPIYNAITVTLANTLFSLVEEPNVTLLKPQGNSVAIYIRDVANPKEEPRLFAYFDYPHSGLAVLVALLLATPALPWRRRLRVIITGTGLLLGIHSGLFIPKTRFEYIQFLVREGIPVADNMYLAYAWLGRALVPVSYVAPFVIWLLLTWRSWLPKLGPRDTPQPQRIPKEARP
uniref:Uncharacterized protein n=2 Tax=Candidatus Bipolaricaulota TaxID=67810 RepID=H5S9X6_9BACT|nr:hypothetical protein HGMM_F03H09C21 [uncultured Acetothermia bacterium]BAL59230.1 hypothetical protein HGMM_OP3C385 [Candidatus Acetothermum autotrophicum]